MTTKVTITCQENSHWDIAVVVQDQVYDFDNKVMTDTWKNSNEILLTAGQTANDMYVHSSRRFLIEERVRPKE